MNVAIPLLTDARKKLKNFASLPGISTLRK